MYIFYAIYYLAPCGETMCKHNIKTTFLRLSRFVSYIMKRGLSRNHSGFLVVRLQGAAVVVVSRQGCFLFFCCHVFFGVDNGGSALGRCLDFHQLIFTPAVVIRLPC